MKAHVGDRLTISGHVVGEAPRIGRIEEVRGDDGSPPYRVKWIDTDHTTLLYPGPDCSITPLAEAGTTGGGS